MGKRPASLIVNGLSAGVTANRLFGPVPSFQFLKSLSVMEKTLSMNSKIDRGRAARRGAFQLAIDPDEPSDWLDSTPDPAEPAIEPRIS